MSILRFPWRLMTLPLCGCLVGLLVALWLHAAANLRWFEQQNSEITQEANLLSRTLASSPDRQQWLQFVQGLPKMNWGQVEILPDSSLSDRSRQSLVVSPTQWIQEPNRFFRISVRQPIKEPSDNSPSEWMIYSRRVRQPNLPWVFRTAMLGIIGSIFGAIWAAIKWQLKRTSTNLKEVLRSIRTSVKRPVSRSELINLFPQPLSHDPIQSEWIALCEQLHQNAFTSIIGSETSDAILSAMPEGILAFSSELRLLFANRAAVDLLNLGTRIQDNIPLVELIRQPKLLQLVQDVQSRQLSLDCNLEATDGNQQNVSLRIRAYYINTGNKSSASGNNIQRTRAYSTEPEPEPAASILLVISDETRVKQLENYRKDFTANVSHELKTPLAAIKAYSETLLMGALEDPDARYRFVTSIGEQANKLDELIRGLMQLSRIQTMPEKLLLTPLRLADVIKSVVKEHRTVADANEISIDNQIESSDPVVLAEFDSLRTILGNLLSNAIRYSKQGTTVTLKVQTHNERLDLLVIDQGIGIPAADIERIFERFYTVDKARSRDSGGTGLGLAIVKHLAIALGGSISVQSQLGTGSTFRLSLRIPNLD